MRRTVAAMLTLGTLGIVAAAILAASNGAFAGGQPSPRVAITINTASATPGVSGTPAGTPSLPPASTQASSGATPNSTHTNPTSKASKGPSSDATRRQEGRPAPNPNPGRG